MTENTATQYNITPDMTADERIAARRAVVAAEAATGTPTAEVDRVARTVAILRTIEVGTEVELEHVVIVGMLAARELVAWNVEADRLELTDKGRTTLRLAAQAGL